MIKIIIGPMYAGKSKRLLEIKEELIKNGKSVIAFTPKTNKRDLSFINSRAGKKSLAIKVSNLKDIRNKIDSYKKTSNEVPNAIILDEGQFMKGNIKDLLILEKEGIDIYIAGLALTSEQEPFGLMPALLPIATDIEVIPAVCCKCGKPALFTICKTNKTNQIDFGDEKYRPVCLDCLEIKN